MKRELTHKELEQRRAASRKRMEGGWTLTPERLARMLEGQRRKREWLRKLEQAAKDSPYVDIRGRMPDTGPIDSKS